MHRVRIKHLPAVIVSCILVAVLLTGCASQAGSDGSSAAEQQKPAPASAQTSAQPSEQPKSATWVIDINSTQQITDEMGILWNYTLTLHASKPGGTDSTGDYSGEAVLKIEPDIGSVKALAAKEGTQLLDMIFQYHAECANLAFEVLPFSPDQYAEKMKQINPDNPLAQFNPGDSTDFFAVASATFDTTQEPISMTINDDGKVRTGTVPGQGTTVAVPTEITIDGASAYCFFYNTPHPLAEAFKGTVTGDVL